MVLEHLETRVTATALSAGVPLDASIIEEARVSFLAALTAEPERLDPEKADLMIALGLR